MVASLAMEILFRRADCLVTTATAATFLLLPMTRPWGWFLSVMALPASTSPLLVFMGSPSQPLSPSFTICPPSKRHATVGVGPWCFPAGPVIASASLPVTLSSSLPTYRSRRSIQQCSQMDHPQSVQRCRVDLFLALHKSHLAVWMVTVMKLVCKVEAIVLLVVSMRLSGSVFFLVGDAEQLLREMEALLVPRRLPQRKPQ